MRGGGVTITTGFVCHVSASIPLKKYHSHAMSEASSEPKGDPPIIDA